MRDTHLNGSRFSDARVDPAPQTALQAEPHVWSARMALGWALPLALILAACAHPSPAPAPAPQPPAGPHQQPPAASPAQRAPSASTIEPDTGAAQAAGLDVAGFMRDHFVIAAWARDAVAEGDLAALREPLRELADYRYSSAVPAAWMRYLARLQAAARVTAEAARLSDAANGVATMARICGECHVQHRVSLQVDFRLPSADPEPEVETLASRMYRHQWASSRLWEGITAPSDEAWQAGANALAEISLTAPEAKTQLTPQTLSLLRQVRELGLAALDANSLEQRAASYASLLSLCSSCHAAHRAARE